MNGKSERFSRGDHHLSELSAAENSEYFFHMFHAELRIFLNRVQIFSAENA
jgi:hypothetical protein